MARDDLGEKNPRPLHAHALRGLRQRALLHHCAPRRRLARGATRFPRRGNAIGWRQQRRRAVGFLDRLDQEDRTQLVFAHLPTVS
jgi:hypothetical protein